ncbi:hypothetical protein [Chryseobacterium nakagawai]|uniref:hypothetical protein n=1 Tax=Chryseobacterium nakagawai TaxID=1241982 RepID=UPI001E3CB5D1|nr:hypothetical protein [Chryseobacterium nakagawai]
MSQGKYKFISTPFYVIVFILFFSCQKKNKTYFEAITINDVKLSAAPKPGSWRYNHDEKFQQFEDFQKSKKIKPEPEKKPFIFSLLVNSLNYRRKKLNSLKNI